MEKDEVLEENEIFKILSRAIKNLDFKLNNGRIKDTKNEKIRLDGFRVLAYLCRSYIELSKKSEPIVIKTAEIPVWLEEIPEDDA